jgi:hypothetical protein
VLGELTDVLNALIASFEVHMVYFSLSQKIFEEIFGRISRMLANIVISRFVQIWRGRVKVTLIFLFLFI